MLNQANPKHTCIHTYIQAYANSEAFNPAKSDTDSSSDEEEEHISKVLLMQIPSSENEKESRQSFLVVERVPENIKRPSERSKSSPGIACVCGSFQRRIRWWRKNRVQSNRMLWECIRQWECLLRKRGTKDRQMTNPITKKYQFNSQNGTGGTKLVLWERQGIQRQILNPKEIVFDKLWTRFDQKVTSLDGKMKNTRGLGYGGKDAFADSSPAEYRSYSQLTLSQETSSQPNGGNDP